MRRPSADGQPSFGGEAAAPVSARVAMPRSGDWWPGGMGHPNHAGSHNGLRYAYFARARRLAIERSGVLTLYDTLGHEIGGVLQQSSPSGGLRFASRHGPIDVMNLPVLG